MNGTMRRDVIRVVGGAAATLLLACSSTDDASGGASRAGSTSLAGGGSTLAEGNGGQSATGGGTTITNGAAGARRSEAGGAGGGMGANGGRDAQLGGAAGDGVSMGGTSAAGASMAGASMAGASTAGASTGGAAINGDTQASRPLAVSAPAARHEHTFRAKDADVGVTFNDNNQIAVVDNRAAKLMGKLVLPFQGQGTTAGTMGAGGEFCAHRGFHVLAIAAFQNYNIVIGDAKFYGDARKEVFEGVEYTHTGDFANVHMTPADGVAQRTQKALQYLHKLYPTEDWGYYLNADGSVRWSDVIFEGMSHGASNAARFGMLVRASRVVSISGPRDNACTSLNANNCGGVVANWFSEAPKTPIDRFYALTGVSDEQHLQHLFAMQRLGYAGEPVDVIGAQPPYGASHRLNASGGHSDYCSQANYKAVCNYMFGVPVENQNGTP